MMPLFSVVIPAFNRACSIGDCLASVVGQTVSDIEIIVVDDGSTDNTADVVKEFKDERVKYLYQANAGGAAARNSGIAAATGRYIAFLDSDDVFLPDHLERAIPFLETIGSCYFSKVRVNRGGDLFFEKPPRGPRSDEDFSEYLFCAGGFVPTITLIVPSQLAKVTLYTGSLRYGQDKDFALRLHVNGASFYFNDVATAVWNDQAGLSRVSSKIDANNRLAWLNSNRQYLTDKAYYSDLGWSVAKAFATDGLMLHAFRLYCGAVLRRCYSPKTAGTVFLQIFLSPLRYRKLADFLVRFGLRP